MVALVKARRDGGHHHHLLGRRPARFVDAGGLRHFKGRRFGRLARNLAQELSPDNIGINCIAPGLIRTDFARALWEIRTISSARPRARRLAASASRTRSPDADLLIVAARSAGAPGETDGLTLFLVDAKAKGIETERSVMVDAHNAARIKFDRVQVDADAVIGEVDRGWRLLEGILNAGRAAVAAELTGVGEGAFGRTLTYLKDRKQFGQPLGSFQALQHRAAHLFTELEITQAAVLKALQVLDSDFARAATIVSVAKARAGASATLAVQKVVQMHGGIGMTDEFDIGFFMKRARVGQELFGDAGFHADRVARSQNY